MNREQAKLYLEQLHLYDAIIDSRMEDLERLKSLSVRATLHWRNDTVKVKHERDCIFLKIIDLEHRIDDTIDKYVDLKAAVNKQIEEIADIKLRTFLTLRFVDNLTMEKIAEKMNYNIRNIYRIQNAALDAFANQ